MCTNKQAITLRNGKVVMVPCGKCEECLEHKQKQFSVMAYRAAVWYGSMHLVTLSYDDDQVPVSSIVCSFDGDDCSWNSDPVYVDGDLRQYYLDNAPVGQYVDSHGCVHWFRKPYWVPCVKEFGEDLRLFMCLSIRKSDVQNMLKKFRVIYNRKYGVLPEFKYTIIPEYGGRTGRPHYHMLVFGLSTRMVRMMLSYWKFGFTQVKKVKALNDDNSDGFAKVAAYVSKYVSKGDFEHKYVSDGRTFKPRITSSRFLGLEDQQQVRTMREFALAYDVFDDKYSVSSPFVAPREYVDDSTGELLRMDMLIRDKVKPTVEAIVRRMYVNINDFHYPLPNSFKNVFYKVYDPLKKRYTSSSLQGTITAYMEAVVNNDIARAFGLLGYDVDSKIDGKTYCQVQNFVRGVQRDRNSRVYDRLRRFYQRSKVE